MGPFLARRVEGSERRGRPFPFPFAVASRAQRGEPSARAMLDSSLRPTSGRGGISSRRGCGMSAGRRMEPEMFVTLRVGQDVDTGKVAVCGVDRVDLSGDWTEYDAGTLEARLKAAIWAEVMRARRKPGE